MANPEHLAILKKGVEDWNRWKHENQGIEPDLVTAKFSGISWENIDLSRARLLGTSFKDSNLAGADLTTANLLGATLTNVNLSKANLLAAKPRETELRDVNFTGADLSWANFRGAKLQRVKLQGATMLETSMGNVEIDEAVGLSTIVFHGPCTIDYRTISKSWPLPVAFLRGCGLPDDYISWLQQRLSGIPVQFYSLFISHSSADEEFAKRLHADLQDKGVRCWFAPHDVQGGRKLHEQIDQAIRLYDRLLLILSERSMASNWVRTEIANARQREMNEGKRVLFPIRLVDFEAIKEWSLFDADTGIDSAREIREYFIPDFSNWTDEESYKVAFERLLKDLKAEKDE